MGLKSPAHDTRYIKRVQQKKQVITELKLSQFVNLVMIFPQ